MAATAKAALGKDKEAGAYTSRRPKQQTFQYNALRALRMVGYSAVIGTPAAHFWYLVSANRRRGWAGRISTEADLPASACWGS
jgi:hypothetical protein